MTGNRVRRGFLWLLENTLNRLTTRLARAGRGPFALVRHVGRTTGRPYETPLILAEVPEGFVAELTYGPDVNWYRNITAAGRCQVVFRGAPLQIDRIESYPADAGIRAFGYPAALVLRLLRRHEFRLLRTLHPDVRTRAAIEEHWRASEAGDNETEHAIYAADAILDYPQSGERFRGRATISAQRGGHPADRHFTVLRIAGRGNLWVSQCVITYDGTPSYSVSIMEFAHDHVVHETQYFADTFGAPAWRAALAEPMPGRDITTA